MARRPAGHTARLSELGPGDVATVVGIDAGDPRAMHKLLALGVMPGSQVEIRQCYPAFVFRLGYAQLAVDEQIASAVLVRR